MNQIQYFEKLTKTMALLSPSAMDLACDAIEATWLAGRQIITLGNGGSSMTAIHFANDWNKSVFLATGKPFLGRSLVDNMGLVMAYGNDMGFEKIFEEQLKNIMAPGDLIIAISGSGNSNNVIRAVQFANSRGNHVLGLTGYDGGLLRGLSTTSLHIPIPDMQIVEDMHFIFGHFVMQRLCSRGPQPLG